MTIFLRTTSIPEMRQALIDGGIFVIDGAGDMALVDGYSYDFIGRIYKATGEVETVEVGGTPSEEPVMEMVPGWHANILGPLTDAQRSVLPILDPPPVTPERVFAE